MNRLLLLIPLALCTPARAAIVTSFEEASLPAAILLDVPTPALGFVTFDAVNDELDFGANGNTDLWGARNNAAIAWTAIPGGLTNGSVWTVETEVRLNSVVESQQVAGLTFYGGPDGSRPDITFGLDNWDPAARAVRMQGLGDNDPNVGILTTAAKVILRVSIQENGATDTYNFFFKVNPGDNWTQLGGVATNYQTSFANSRVGLTYKTGAAKSGSAFTYLNVLTSTDPPVITAHPAPVTSIVGGVARFSASASGATSYKWRRNTVDVPVGGTEPTYVVDPVTADDNGASFDCITSNSNGNTPTNAATLTTATAVISSPYYSSAVQAEPSLLAYFPVDGSTGSTVANVKNPLYGGIVGGTAGHDSTAGRTVGGRGLAFNSAGWVGLSKDPAWDFPDGNGTVEMFLYQTATAGYNPCVFAVRNGGAGTRYSFHSDAAGTKFWFFNGTGAPTWNLPANGIGRLMHVAFVINNGQCTLYHNGVSLGSINQTLGSGVNVPAEIGASAPSAAESFPGNIDEVAIYADPLPASAVTAHYAAWQSSVAGSAPSITTQPGNQSVNEGALASFSVVLADATGASYRWQKNGVDIAGATSATHSFNPVAADNAAQFRCVVYNPFGGALSTAATLTVIDLNPPQLTSAASPLTPSRIVLTFNEAVDLTGATFTLSAGTVTGVTAGPLPNMVTLTVTGLTFGQNATVTANNVRDTSGNVLATVSSPFTAAPPPVPAPIDLVRPGSEPIGPATRRGPFVFSEIHYHPRDRADLKNLEFIEIYNGQPWAEDLSGFRITGEVTYTFPAGTTIPAGSYRVVAAVPADVMAAYSISGVFGPWTGALSNSGGNVRLRDASNAVVFTVDYDAGSPWPVAADGSGHSMILARPSYGMEDPRAWDISANLDGSPGTAEPVASDPSRAVVINEIRANAPSAAEDFIELYNYSTAAVDVSGCSLSDDRDAAKFVFPAGTTIAPGLFLSYYQPQLGFGTKAGGDTIYFRAPGSGGAPGRVIDAVRFGPQYPGTSWGRSPDGSPYFSALSGGGNAGGPNQTPAEKAAVISEILYHPPPGSTQAPFVEINNTSGAVLDVGGWRLRGGVSYDVPAGTSLAAGARLAITAFSGSLNKGSGERLRLEKPVTNLDGTVAETIYPVIDEVTYGTGGRWGRWSDGGGSSLELRDLRSDGRFAGNWADSEESGESGWMTIQNTGVLDNGSGAPINRLHIMMLGAGECLVDDVEVIPNGGSNIISNGGFESGTAGWLMNGTHETSSTETGGFSGSFALHVRATGRGDLAGNRISVPLNVTPGTGSTATIRAKVKWLRGHPEILFRLNGGNLEGTGNMLPNTVAPGTPGAANSRAQANTGPSVSSVTHRPVLPQAGQAVTVYARLDDPDGIGLALLNYRIDPQTTVNTVVMSYRGAGLFSGDIPAQATPVLAAFHVTAYDSTGAVSAFPADAPARECLVRWNEPTPAGTLGVYRMWMTEATRSRWASRLKNSNAPLDVTFIYGNSRVIYNAGAQYSGSPFHTPGFSGPTGGNCDYDLTMPPDDRLLGETDTLLCGPGTFGDDASLIREQTIWWIARKIGLPAIHRRFCRVFVNGAQRQAVFEDTQQPNGGWIDEHWPGDNDGHLHKAQDWIEYADDGGTFQTDNRAFLTKASTTGGAHKIAAYRYQWSKRSVEGSANDWADFTTLVNAFNTGSSGTDPAFFNALDPLVDQDSWARALAVQRIAGNWDTWGYTYGKNMYIYKPQNGPWAMTAWDIDFSFGLVGDGATTGLFVSTQDPMATKFRNNPDFGRAYWRAFRDAVDGPMLNTNVNARIDAMVSGLAATGVSANASQVSTVKSYIDARRTYIISQLNGVYSTTSFAITGSNALTDADGVLTLTGTAPPGVRRFRINGVEYTPSWTSLTVWNLPLTLFAAHNVLTVEGIGSSGNVVGTFPVTIDVTGPPPLPPITINEWMADNTSTFADPVDGNFEDWFELHNSGGAAVNLGGFYLTDTSSNKTLYPIPAGTIVPAGGYLIVWADDEAGQNATVNGQLHAGFKLSAGGESIGLYTPDGTQVDLIDFTGQSSDVAQGRYPDSNAGLFPLAPTPGKRNALPPEVVSIAGTGAGTLTFSTEPTHNYQVESSDNLLTWAPNGVPLTATGTTLSVNLPASPGRRAFWRARLVIP
ncbi:MAG TPA: lamin tail domain-containing protein [Verrucomicrobiales bacterium]|nr:lamin tail domain-containing protein [Verrucomicrobiales bacterium]